MQHMKQYQKALAKLELEKQVIENKLHKLNKQIEPLQSKHDALNKQFSRIVACIYNIKALLPDDHSPF